MHNNGRAAAPAHKIFYNALNSFSPLVWEPGDVVNDGGSLGRNDMADTLPGINPLEVFIGYQLSNTKLGLVPNCNDHIFSGEKIFWAATQKNNENVSVDFSCDGQ